MIFNIKRFFIVIFVFLPSICCGIDLNTKIAWEPWAVNSAVMDFCMPELEDGKWLGEGRNSAVWQDRKDLGSVGNVSMFITNFNEGGVIRKESVKFIPKCAAFIDAYIVQTQKNKKVSLNQIISMCLDTIQDKLVCENITLTLVNITEDKNVLKKYDPKKIEQKIRDSINADHTICSTDGVFCTTYSMFTERGKDFFSLEGVDGDAIYKKSDNQIVGMCAGINYNDAKGRVFFHKESRCISTSPDYELYEFDIQDLSDKSINLTYTDYGALKNKVKDGLETINTWIQQLESCLTNKQESVDTSRALNADYAVLGLDLCERDNSTQDTIAICKTQVLKAHHKKTTQNIQELTFEKAESRLGIYKSMLESYFLDAMVLQHQTDLLLTECENQ